MEKNAASKIADALLMLSDRIGKLELRIVSSELMIAALIQHVPKQEFLRTLDSREASLEDQTNLTADQKRTIRNHLLPFREGVQQWIESHPEISPSPQSE